MIAAFLKGLVALVPVKYWLGIGLTITAVVGAFAGYHYLRSTFESAAISRVEKGNVDAKERGLDAKEKALQDYDTCLANDGKWNRAKLVCESP